MAFNLERFEYQVYTRQHESAARELMSLLVALDANYGLMGDGFAAIPLSSILPEDVDGHVLTRIAGAATCLFADNTFQFSPQGYGQIVNWHRWLSSLFAASAYRNADHVIRALNMIGDDGASQLQVADKDLVKFSLLFSPESEISLDLDAFWEHNKVLAAGLCMVLLSPRFLGTPHAHGKRELILPWLTKKLEEIEDLNLLPAGILHDVYMHCSYADEPRKHEIKIPINALIRRKFAEVGLKPVRTPASVASTKHGKPVLLVVVEWFNNAHSIYRTHSRTIHAARKLFHVIGMGYPVSVDAAGRAIFDEFIEISATDVLGQLAQIRAVADERKPQVLYMPSVGMFPLTMYLANLRLAPIQAMALGHPATSFSPEMDYVVVEEDYVGDPSCFSEELLTLPSDGMPYRPSAAAEGLVFDITLAQEPEIVQIAVCSTPMKLNPKFLMACRRIIETSAVKVHFQFLVGQAQGLIYPQVRSVVRQFLGDYATVHPHQNYAGYMKVISTCHMFINPFPFGNTNGIIDTVTAGLVGICKTGREVHEHIDEGLFGRLSFPAWMVAHTDDEYVVAAVRLANDHAERNLLARTLSGADSVQKLFEGRPEIFGVRLMAKLKAKAKAKKQTRTPAFAD